MSCRKNTIVIGCSGWTKGEPFGHEISKICTECDIHPNGCQEFRKKYKFTRIRE